MHRVPVDSGEADLLVVAEHGLGDDRSWRHDVPVRQDEAALGVDDETGGLTGRIPLRIECAGTVDPDGHHAGGDPVESAGPGGVLGGLCRREQHKRAEDGEESVLCHESPVSLGI